MVSQWRGGAAYTAAAVTDGQRGAPAGPGEWGNGREELHACNPCGVTYPGWGGVLLRYVCLSRYLFAATYPTVLWIWIWVCCGCSPLRRAGPHRWIPLHLPPPPPIQAALLYCFNLFSSIVPPPLHGCGVTIVIQHPPLQAALLNRCNLLSSIAPLRSTTSASWSPPAPR